MDERRKKHNIIRREKAIKNKVEVKRNEPGELPGSFLLTSLFIFRECRPFDRRAVLYFIHHLIVGSFVVAQSTNLGYTSSICCPSCLKSISNTSG